MLGRYAGRLKEKKKKTVRNQRFLFLKFQFYLYIIKILNKFMWNINSAFIFSSINDLQEFLIILSPQTFSRINIFDIIDKLFYHLN